MWGVDQTCDALHAVHSVLAFRARAHQPSELLTATMRVLVTGGTRGIGCAIVEALAGAHTVYVGCRDLRAGSELATKLGGDGIVPVRLDVTDPATVAAAVAQIEASGTQLDVLVNNAGVLLERAGMIGGIIQQVHLGGIIQPTLEVNVDGVIAVTEAFLPLVADGGQIINVSSGVATRATGKLSSADRAELEAAGDGAALRDAVSRLCHEAAALPHQPGDTPMYGLSKMWLNFYTQLLARRVARLRVNACSPGFCRTEIAGSDADYSKREPKSAALGATVVLKLISGSVGTGTTGRFFKECSKPGTPLEEARTSEEGWVA